MTDQYLICEQRSSLVFWPTRSWPLACVFGCPRKNKSYLCGLIMAATPGDSALLASHCTEMLQDSVLLFPTTNKIATALSGRNFCQSDRPTNPLILSPGRCRSFPPLFVPFSQIIKAAVPCHFTFGCQEARSVIPNSGLSFLFLSFPPPLLLFRLISSFLLLHLHSLIIFPLLLCASRSLLSNPSSDKPAGHSRRLLRPFFFTRTSYTRSWRVLTTARLFA